MSAPAPDLLALARRSWPDWFGRPAGRLRLVALDESRSHADRALALVFEGSARSPAVALKWARSPREAGYVAHEATALTAVRPRLPPDLRATVPRPLALERWGEQAVAVMTVLPGTRVADPFAERRAGSRAAARALRCFAREALEWSRALAASTTDAPLESRALAGIAREFSARLVADPSEQEAVASFADAVEGAGVSVGACWQHGDLSPRNTLRHGGRLRYLDWEHAASRVEPWMDAATLARNVYLTSMRAAARAEPRRALASFLGGGHPAGAVVREALADWPYPVPVGWGLAITWMRHALARSDEGRGGVDSYREPALALLVDAPTRAGGGPLVPRW